jgi:hypothetical protein
VGAKAGQANGKPTAWQTPDHLALFYPTAAGPQPTLRLKSIRAGQQPGECLTI